MKKLCTALIVLCLSASAFAAGPIVTGSITTNSNCVVIATDQQATVGIAVTGTFTGTLQPEVSVGGQPASNAAVYPAGSTTSQSTITAVGSFSAPVAGFTTFLVCPSGSITGSATVTLTAQPGTSASKGTGGGSSGTVTSVAPGGGIKSSPNPITGTGTISLNLADTLGYNAEGTGTGVPVFDPDVIAADRFPGTGSTDPCDKTLSAEASINGNSSPAVSMRGFIGTTLPCAEPLLASTFSGHLYLPAGALQLNGTGTFGSVNGATVQFGGSVELEGVTIGTNSANGSLLQAKQGSWPAGQGANFAPLGLPAGTYASPPTYNVANTYNWGYGVVNSAVNYYALADGITSGTPGTDWTKWTLLSSVPSPVLQPIANNRASIQNSGFHNFSLDCQYVAATNAITDGCIGFNNLSAQELTVFDPMMIRNPTIAGVQMSDFVPNSGPFSGQVVYTGPSGTNDQNACKINTSDSLVTNQEGLQGAAISTITVSGTLATVTLSSAPSFNLYSQAFVDIVNSSAAFSNYAAGVVDESANTHGFWQTWSVESTTVFTMVVPSGTAACASSCGFAYFFPTAITVNTTTPTLINTKQNNRGFDSWTANGSNCPSSSANTHYYDYPPLAFQFCTGNSPLRNWHSEGHRVAVAIGACGGSDGQQIINGWPNVNTHVGILIDNKFGEPTNLDIENFRANISSGGNVGTGSVPNPIVDLGNGNTLTIAKNPFILSYKTDKNGYPHMLLMDCTDIQKGECFDGTSNSGWYIGGILVLGINPANGGLTFKGSTSGTFGTVGATATGGTLNLGSNATLTAAGALTVTSCSGCGGGASAWSALTNPAGNLALTMGSNTSIFNYTTGLAQAFAWKNTTAALVGASQSSPNLALCGTEWHASASTEGCLNLQFVPGTGTDAANTFSFTHTGSAIGVTTAQFPGPVASGTSGSNAGQLVLPGNTATGTLPANSFSIFGPNSASFTSFGWQPPTAENASAGVVLVGAASSHVSQLTVGTVPNSDLTNPATTVNGQTCTLGSTCAVESATSGQVAISGGAGSAMTGAADMTYSTHTFATITTGIFDWSAATGAASFKPPAVAGGTLLAGTVTAALTAPAVFQNTNSTNNNSSIAAIFSTPGTSTGQVTAYFNGASTGAALIKAGTGGTVSSGAISGQTDVFVVQPTGYTAFGTDPACTAGTGGGWCGTEGTGAIGKASTGLMWADSANHNIRWNSNNATTQGLPVSVMLTSQYTNSTTGFTNVTGTNSLAFAAAASTNYTMTCTLYYQAASTGGLNIEFTGPASPTNITYSLVDPGSATALVQAAVATAYSTSLGAAVTTATTNFPATVTLSLQNGTNAGTVQMLAKSSAAVQLQIQNGSFCTWQSQ